MLKRLAKCIREYKLPTILTLIFIIGEAVIETAIPFITVTHGLARRRRWIIRSALRVQPTQGKPSR